MRIAYPFYVAAMRERKSRQIGVSHDRTIFVDVSAISVEDAGTGIQRVVRELASRLKAGAVGYKVVFVAATRESPYRVIDLPTCRETRRGDINCKRGDVFLGLDYSLDTTIWHQRQILRFRRAGAQVWYLVHDFLPLNHPEWFSRATVIRFRRWLDVISLTADGIFCNSRDTQEALRSVFLDRYNLSLKTAILPMGFSFEASRESGGTRSAETPNRFTNRSSSFFLMVGTIEPRKAHLDVIRAFEILWENGCEDELVIIGRKGWKVDAVANIIESHPLLGKLLFWYRDVEDAELIGAYQNCLGAVMASYGEGFGLPVIEALGHGKPVLARNLPVFSEHEKCGVWMFPANADTLGLAENIQEWSSHVKSGRILVSRPIGKWDAAAEIIFSSLTTE